MSDCPAGSFKYDPVTKSMAIRTHQPLESPNPMVESHAWQIITPGGTYLKGEPAVAGWVDVPIALLDGLAAGEG